MNRIVLISFLFVCFVAVAGALLSAAKGVEAPDTTVNGPFLDGKLNPNLQWQGTRIIGTVLEIKDGINEGKLYKVDPEQEGVDPIWVTTFVRIIDGQINVGDTLAFKGYISSANYLDPEGTLESLIGTPLLLRARTIESP